MDDDIHAHTARTRRRDLRPDQASSAISARSTASIWRSRAAPSTACSGRTAPARRRRSGSSPRCCDRTAGSARVLGHDVVREAAAVRRRVSLTAQFASVDEDLTAVENLVLLARLLGILVGGRQGARARAARRVRPRRRRRPPGRGSSRAACAAGSTSRRASSSRPTCCSSTSRPPAWTRAAATRSGRSCARSSPTARRCC